MIKIAISILISLCLTACISTTPSGPRNLTDNSRTFVYEPNQRDQFIFKTWQAELAKYPYRSLCFSMPKISVDIDRCFTDTLAYAAFVGKRGYYTNREAFEDYRGYIVREAVIETGDVIYLISSKKRESKSDVIHLTEFAPGEKELFVFDEIPSVLQKYGYTDICLSMPIEKSYISPSTICSDRLPYKDKLGKKGYYTDGAPLKGESDQKVREAVLESGEIIYLVPSESKSYIASMADYLKRKNFKPEPIFSDSNVLITGYSKLLKEQLNVSSQNKHSFTVKEIAAIRQIASNYPQHGKEIAELLTLLKVDYDEFEGRTTVRGLGYNNPDSYLSIKIIFGDDGYTVPYVSARYESDDWLFVKSYSIVADEFRWDSGFLDFERDNSAGFIWEWNNQLLRPEHIDVMSKISKASKAAVRFRGRQYHATRELTVKQKDELSNLVRLAELIGSK